MKFTRIIRINRVVRGLLFATTLWPATSSHAQSCRLALLLALDVSGSVNATEYSQQISGLATALNDPDVRQLILLGADAPMAFAVYEWSSRNHQYVIQPWILLDSPAALDAAIARIGAHRPVRAGLKTALGTSLTFGAGMLDQQSRCWQLTLDVSGDGRNNIGATPHQAYELDVFDRVTVNALVIGDPKGASLDGNGSMPDALRQYFEVDVIRGTNAFSIVANGYADYADAMRRKLIREMTLPMFGQFMATRDLDGRVRFSADN